MSMRSIAVVPADPEEFDRCRIDGAGRPGYTLRDLLIEQPALTTAPLSEAQLDVPVGRLFIEAVPADPTTPLFLPRGISLTGMGTGEPEPAPGPDPEPAAGPDPEPAGDGGAPLPPSLTEREAVLLAHDAEIAEAAAFLKSGVSVLVRCEKLLVEHLAAEIAARSRRPKRVVRLTGTPAAPSPLQALGGGRQSELVAAFQKAVLSAADGEVVVVPHLDLLAGGSDASLTSEARELTDVLYERAACVLLAFVDPSLQLPEVLANRFAARRAIDILPRQVVVGGSRVPIGSVLVTREEADTFGGFDATDLYKHIAGMNAVRLRQGVRFAADKHRQLGGAPTFADLIAELREFKANSSADSFEIPNTTFEQIGGYQTVKDELTKAIEIINGAEGIPEKLRFDLVPKGFIFHGPPGTGKTLFAKAVATLLGGSILVVSGPEITDKYVGESERKIRDLFAQARRNAPAVVVFDEFDSIAARRTGRDDGGSRAGNAIVAQLLTELDGFRHEVPVLIIGTTNRLDLIDEALLRPSRFRAIAIDLPDEDARGKIATYHAGRFGYTLGPRLLAAIVEATRLMNGDEIGSIFREAKADELVGSKQPASAATLGAFVAALRSAQQKRERERGRGTGTRRPPARQQRAHWVSPTGNAAGAPTDPVSTSGTDRNSA
jgi:transitional endoplasmic reticulum ATPase